MKNINKTLFISDLHLDKNHPEVVRLFLTFLQNCDASSIDALYILGDLFEIWIGDDAISPFHREIMRALKSATERGIPIYFLPGNRDFLMGKKFLRETGCQRLPDEHRIDLYQVPVLLMHGDTLCTRDQRYLAFRKKARNPLIKTLFLLLPLKTRKRLAAKGRITSKQHTTFTALEIMDVTQEEVESVMQKHQVQHLIHGHTHRPSIHHFMLQSTITPATRIVLGAWHERGSVLIWDENGGKELIEI